MKGIITKPFQLLTDVNPVWDFMAEVYDHDRSNGMPAPFFEYALSSSWLDKNYLFMDRLWLDGDRVVAFAFYEEPCTDVYVNLRPGYEALAEEILEYGETQMPRFDGEKAFVLFPGQTALIEASRRSPIRPMNTTSSSPTRRGNTPASRACGGWRETSWPTWSRYARSRNTATGAWPRRRCPGTPGDCARWAPNA